MPVDVNGISFSSSAGTTLAMSKSGTTWLNVASNGVVTRPQIPYMKAILSGQGSFYRANPVTFGSVIANVGSCWNNSTGYFTCPRAGYYLMGMSGIAAGGGHGTGFTSGYFYLMKNGSSVHFSHWNHASYWEYVNLSGVISCAANDTLSFQINTGTGYFYGGGDHGNFYITLLR
jgi:hypothetical protein